MESPSGPDIAERMEKKSPPEGCSPDPLCVPQPRQYRVSPASKDQGQHAQNQERLTMGQERTEGWDRMGWDGV
eukprot:1110109-Rhodomonas_salina.5